MELTPQLLDEQEFPVVLRGYDTDAVDDFLERVGAGVAALLDRVEQARARMVGLEGELAAAKAAAPPEDPVGRQVQEVSRALVLAQEAADKTLAEATSEAERTLRQATAEAEKTLGEATAEAERDRSAARVEADSMLAAARRELDQRTASMDAEIDAHAAARRAEREEEIARLAALEQRRRAELQRLEEQFQSQRERLSAVAAAAALLMEEHQLDPVPPDELEAAAAGSAAAGSAAPSLSPTDPESTALLEAVRPDAAPVGSTAEAEEASQATEVTGVSEGNGDTGENEIGAPEPEAQEADVVADSSQADRSKAPSSQADDASVAPAAEPEHEAGDHEAGDQGAGDRGAGAGEPAIPGIPPSPPPRLTSPDADTLGSGELDSSGPAAATAPTWRQSQSVVAAEVVSAQSSPVEEGSTFWRPTGADRGLFDQDDASVAPPTPHLRSVAPPDDDPFLAALRGDDQAAAMLHDQVHEDNPTGFMRLLRRR